MRRIAAVCLVTMVLLASLRVVLAEEASPQGSHPILPAGLAGVLGGVNDSPFIIAAVTPADHFLVAAGLSFNYNGYGQKDAAGNTLSDKVATNLVLAAQYMIVDHAPFAMGPELFAVGSLTPGSALDSLLLRPAWAFWYTPWNGPIAIGSAIAVEIAVPTRSGQKPLINLTTPALRIGYIFNGI